MLRRLLALALLAAAPRPALAADVWTEPFPGVRYLHRSTSEPKEIHALIVDLSRPELTVRATREQEKGRTTSSFASLVGAVAAVNGDFYDTSGSYDPLGLAIGEGTVWSPDTRTHRFVACTASSGCTIETAAQATAVDPAWRSAVGGNRLLVDGGQVVQSAADDRTCGAFCTTEHPRTAAGVSADGRILVLVVVEGRRSPVLGMTTNRLARLMLELGSHVALNLDGGGSSAMVVDGRRVSARPANEPAERRVSNHLAILRSAPVARTGRLVGFVREGDIEDAGANLVGAEVRLSTGERAVTGANGLYEFAAVAPGDVDVTASHPGFTPVTASKTIVAGTTNWRSIALVRARADAGVTDAASADAGRPAPPDAGTFDAGGPADAGELDAGDLDAGEAEPVPDAATATAADAGDLDPAPLADAATSTAPPPGPRLDAPAAGGCGCRSTTRPADTLAGLALAGLALLAGRRRRAAGAPAEPR
jgi:MYXO-CTERM domain-containing protein